MIGLGVMNRIGVFMIAALLALAMTGASRAENGSPAGSRDWPYYAGDPASTPTLLEKRSAAAGEVTTERVPPASRSASGIPEGTAQIVQRMSAADRIIPR